MQWTFKVTIQPWETESVICGVCSNYGERVSKLNDRTSSWRLQRSGELSGVETRPLVSECEPGDSFQFDVSALTTCSPEGCDIQLPSYINSCVMYSNLKRLH